MKTYKTAWGQRYIQAIKVDNTEKCLKEIKENFNVDAIDDIWGKISVKQDEDTQSFEQPPTIGNYLKHTLIVPYIGEYLIKTPEGESITMPEYDFNLLYTEV